ncbi:MAG TPA: ATP-binding protein [Anaerolineae bacterium]
MSWFRQLRWKLFISHLSVLLVGVVMLLTTAHFFSSVLLSPNNPLGFNSTGIETTPFASSGIAPPPLTDQERFQAVIDQSLLLAGFGAFAAAVAVSVYVSRRIVEPLQELAQVSRRLSQGYYHERTSIRSDDEFAALSASLNQLAEAIERTEQRRLGLITDVAHELRTPLTTIEGYMEGLIDGVIQPEPQTFAMLQHEAVRLKWLIEEMALLSRAEAGLLRVEPKPIDLHTVIEYVAAQFQPQFVSQELSLVLELPRDLPVVLADPDRVEQILINLLANALQYTRSGGAVTLLAESFDYYVRVAVRDTGIGIPTEHLSHIFERFYRVDKSRARTSGGTGIGLTIARHLVYAHGGEIWVESEGPGKGTTFYFTLPVHEPEVIEGIRSP